jgi:hypothetical protein
MKMKVFQNIFSILLRGTYEVKSMGLCFKMWFYVQLIKVFLVLFIVA